MRDANYADDRLARLYDALEPDRSDLDIYRSIAGELGAMRVLDIGCGTGTFALMLADDGCDVIGLEPARASLTIARTKPGADRVRWIDGTAHNLPDNTTVDLVTMTANVAQAISTPAAWNATLSAAANVLGAGGHLVFGSRIPSVQAWTYWTEDATRETTDVPGVGPVTTWTDVPVVALPLITYRTTYVLPDGDTITSESELRYRERDEITTDLHRHGFVVDDIRDPPARSGLEWLVIARHPGRTSRNARE